MSGDISEESKAKGREVRVAMGDSPRPRSPANAAGLDLVPGLEDYVLGVNFGEIWSRPHLDLKQRCGLVLGMLTVMGLDPQIRPYVGYALKLGWTPEEICEIFVQSISYAGLPTAFNALRVAAEVFKEQGVTPAPTETP
jgi:4-carboxymuconolactone decarboxylase